MRPGPESDGIGITRISTGLECCRVELDDAQPTLMVHTVGPALRVGLISSNRPDIMRFSVIVPRDDFDHVDLVSHSDDLLHPGG